MGTSKILIDGVGIDLTQDTVAANKMLSGIKAHDSNGDSVTGSIQTWAGQQKSGVKNITGNGIFDVSEYASANVNVPVGSMNSKTFFFTLTQNADNDQIIVANDPDVAAHYADATFLIAVANLTGGDSYNRILWSIVCNTPNNGFYGVNSYMGSSSSSVIQISTDAKSTVGQKVYADSSGNLRLFSSNPASTARPWAAGTYICVVAW